MSAMFLFLFKMYLGYIEAFICFVAFPWKSVMDCSRLRIIIKDNWTSHFLLIIISKLFLNITEFDVLDMWCGLPCFPFIHLTQCFFEYIFFMFRELFGLWLSWFWFIPTIIFVIFFIEFRSEFNKKLSSSF